LGSSQLTKTDDDSDDDDEIVCVHDAQFSPQVLPTGGRRVPFERWCVRSKNAIQTSTGAPILRTALAYDVRMTLHQSDEYHNENPQRTMNVRMYRGFTSGLLRYSVT
jgi:hypothetical protein